MNHDIPPLTRGIIDPGTASLAEENRRLRLALNEAAYLLDQLDCLAVLSHPSLYQRVQRWKAQKP